MVSKKGLIIILIMELSSACLYATLFVSLVTLNFRKFKVAMNPTLLYANIVANWKIVVFFIGYWWKVLETIASSLKISYRKDSNNECYFKIYDLDL